MRKVVAICVTSGLLLFAGSAFASADLFKKSNCMACHAVDQKRYGPSLEKIAAKYKGDDSVVDMLASKIQLGGGGVWGKAQMPAQSQVSDADAKTLVKYILSTK
jgi:cytochrome c